MAGGTFDKSVGKTRPGTYINVKSTRQSSISGSERGTVILPLANTNYGPAGKMINISAESPDSARALLGYSIQDNDPGDNMLLIREAFKGAANVIVYICSEGKTAATGKGGGLNATAKYKGTRGNDLEFTVAANPVSGFDIIVYLGDSKVESYENVMTVDELANSEYITFTPVENEEISAVAGVKLTGGENTTATNDGISEFLGASELVAWNTMAFPFTDSSLQAVALAKIKYLRENVGRYVQAICPNFAADYEGIINVTNSYALEDRELTVAQATAYVAGITAGASNVQSNTYKNVSGAVRVVGVKNNEQSINSIKKGEFFFSVSDDGNVVPEYDINSLVTISDGKDESYKKNRVMRVFDSLCESIRLNFPPNKFNNDEVGWGVMEGIGKTILKQFLDAGAITNADYEADFLVDKENSKGDSTYFNVAIQPVDSAEKLYFTVSTK